MFTLAEFYSGRLASKNSFSHSKIGRNKLHSFCKISANIFSLLDFKMCLHSWLFDLLIQEILFGWCGCKLFWIQGSWVLRVTCAFQEWSVPEWSGPKFFEATSTRAERETSWTIVHQSQLDLAKECTVLLEVSLYCAFGRNPACHEDALSAQIAFGFIWKVSIHSWSFGNNFRWRRTLTLTNCEMWCRSIQDKKSSVHGIQRGSPTPQAPDTARCQPPQHSRRHFWLSRIKWRSTGGHRQRRIESGWPTAPQDGSRKRTAYPWENRMEPTGRAVVKMKRKTRPPLGVEDWSARARALSKVIPSRVRLSVLTGANLIKFWLWQAATPWWVISVFW